MAVTRKMAWLPASVAVALAGAALIGSGCAAGCERGSWMGDSWVKASRSLVAPSEANLALAVEAANGSIEISAGATSEVKITAEVRATTQERLDATTVKAERVNGELKVWAEWPGERKPNEGVSFVITVPEGAVGKARAASSNGSLTLSGLAGPLDARTSNGAIRVKDHRGAVSARTSNGSVTVDGSSGPLVIATSNGSVKASLTPLAGGGAGDASVDIATSNGSVTVALPAGFAGEMSVDTSNGRISVPAGVEGADKGSKTSKRLRFGGASSPVSKIRTSNGSVTIE